MSTFTAERRLRKFLARAERALSTPLLMRGDELYEMQLTWQQDRQNGAVTFAGLQFPTIEGGELDSAIIVMRPFFLKSEDAYLPKVVDALIVLSDEAHAEALRANGLATLVGEFVRDGTLVGGNFFCSGRLEMDNDSGEPGQLLSSGQIAMDYIYGMALHEDERRLRRLSYTSGEETAVRATAIELHHLLRAVATVREQVRSSLDNGHLEIEFEIGPVSDLSLLRDGSQGSTGLGSTSTSA